MSHRGILTIAFGKEYDELAALCFRYSRKYTELPIQVITNIKNRSSVWESVTNVQFSFFDADRDKNRSYKTLMNTYSIFDETLYIDCDSIIQNEGINDYIEKIPDKGLLLNIFDKWLSKNQVYAIYKEAYIKAGILPPVNVYYGACIGFTKYIDNTNFFNLWNSNWVANGSGRDMPSLSCAVKLSNVDKVELESNDKLFTWLPNEAAIIQHNYNGCILKKIGYNDFKSYKPFDTSRSDMWVKDWL